MTQQANVVKQETCEECCTTGACPFAYNEYSEMVVNYGCLPCIGEIINMRVNHNKTWACHSNPTKPCLGALRYMKEHNIECTVVDPVLVTENDPWHILGKTV